MVEQGWTQRDIAKELKITEQTICNWKKLPEFIEAYQKATKQEMNLLAAEAVRTLRTLMRTSTSDGVRLNAAKEILNRTGYEPVEYKRVDRPEFMKEEHEGQGRTVIYLPEKEMTEETFCGTFSADRAERTVENMSPQTIEAFAEAIRKTESKGGKL